MLPATPPPRRGRPATGINTKVIRVPLDFDRETALKMYYEWLPIIREYKEIAELFPLPVRNHKLVQMFEEIGDVPQLM
jgi:hypothetical protein